MQNTSLNFWKPETPVLHINSAAYTRIAFLNQWAFDVILSSNQLSQDFKVSNGGPINNKIPVKIDRCLYKNQNLKLGSLSVKLT